MESTYAESSPLDLGLAAGEKQNRMVINYQVYNIYTSNGYYYILRLGTSKRNRYTQN